MRKADLQAHFDQCACDCCQAIKPVCLLLVRERDEATADRERFEREKHDLRRENRERKQEVVNIEEELGREIRVLGDVVMLMERLWNLHEDGIRALDPTLASRIEDALTEAGS